jgi:hypothetical protein
MLLVVDLLMDFDSKPAFLSRFEGLVQARLSRDEKRELNTPEGAARAEAATANE